MGKFKLHLLLLLCFCGFHAQANSPNIGYVITTDGNTLYGEKVTYYFALWKDLHVNLVKANGEKIKFSLEEITAAQLTWRGEPSDFVQVIRVNPPKKKSYLTLMQPISLGEIKLYNSEIHTSEPEPFLRSSIYNGYLSHKGFRKIVRPHFKSCEVMHQLHPKKFDWWYKRHAQLILDYNLLCTDQK